MRPSRRRVPDDFLTFASDRPEHVNVRLCTPADRVRHSPYIKVRIGLGRAR